MGTTSAEPSRLINPPQSLGWVRLDRPTLRLSVSRELAFRVPRSQRSPQGRSADSGGHRNRSGPICSIGFLKPRHGAEIATSTLLEIVPVAVRPSGRMAASESSEAAEMCASVGTVSGPLMFRFAPVLRWLLEPLLRRRLPDEIR